MIGIIMEQLRKMGILFSQEMMIKISFRKHKGYWPDLQNPKTFSEKIQWFKRYVRDPVIPRCADKYLVREYVTKKIGGGYLVPLLGVYNSVEEVKLADLPEEFVLKPNHLSGEVLICKDKEHFDWSAARKRMKKWLKTNYYYQTGEWGYKDIQPRILCEKLLRGDIIDYRFFCIKGNPVICNLTGDAGHSSRQGYVDHNFKSIRDYWGRTCDGFDKPEQWNSLLQVAACLAEDFPFVRVDLYDIKGKIYFGELTFSPSNGMDRYLSEELDKWLGAKYDLGPYSQELIKRGVIEHWARS